MGPKTIQQVQQEHTEAWMALPDVVGTAVGQENGQPCILIFVAADAGRIENRIPSAVEGYPVVVRHTGRIRALDAP